MNAPTVDPLYHAAEIMELWNISETTLKDAIKSGELPGFHDNGKFATKARFINEWLESRIKTSKTLTPLSVNKFSKKTNASEWDKFHRSNRN